ncbi:Ubiquitin domain-containing protein 2 [Mortierella hygrophila]|uniref:Ubiquitin domain-containing protein 2 n=1 Tax=Mortierella hygrophila TaxID=979708 RepID=A0A9P6F386_9FUNG|nr:Ubiquitin domain-containing protein 2 [Mortierella hygrophila]
MGCCSSILIEDDSESGYGGRKILALKRHRWKAPVPPPTRIQLEREREEFWDTAPIYDGRAEVWQALKAVCCDTENDPDQLQSILDEARITIPSYVAPELIAAAAGNIDGAEGGGSASRRSWRNQRQDPMAHLACYDHLGNLYVVPLKILSDPGNLVENSGLGGGSGEEGSSGGSGRDATQSRREQQHSDNLVVPAEQQGQEETTVRIRVSNSQKEVSLSVLGPYTTIGQIKARLVEGGFVRSEKSFMRVLFLGRVLEDKERLEGVVHFQVGDQGTVLQVLVSDP